MPDIANLINEDGTEVYSLSQAGVITCTNIVLEQTTSNEASVVVGTGTRWVLLTGTSQAVALPAGVDGHQLTIKDANGSAALSPITVTPDGLETIDGESSLDIDSDYASITLIFSGTEWSLV